MNIKSYVLCRIVPLSTTLSDPEPQFQGHSIVCRRISRKRCIRSTPCLVLGEVFGVGESNGAISGWIIFKMAADGYLGMMALSRVTLASAGLSCLVGFVAVLSTSVDRSVCLYLCMRVRVCECSSR